MGFIAEEAGNTEPFYMSEMHGTPQVEDSTIIS
jgi:hypothetical protein